MTAIGPCKCGEQSTALFPLHGEKGGPLCCVLCLGNWHAEQGRKRNRGRVMFRAIKNYFAAGGKTGDIDSLITLAAFDSLNINIEGSALQTDPLGFMDGIAKFADEVVELTTELLTDLLVVVHPDKHPSERKDLAHRVTAQLLALKPFVFPALIPKPTTPLRPQESTKPPEPKPDAKPVFPCANCRSTTPYYYCDPCKAEWRKQYEREREQERTQRRKWYEKRKELRLRSRPPATCAECGTQFKGRRADARFCSAACRQRAHRVTAKSKPDESTSPICDSAADPMCHG
jgi:hypothetical protein